MSTAALLLAGLTSSLYISTKTLTPDATATSESNRSSLALTRIATDLRLALNFTERTATALTFTVPDRTGDGVVETIRYSWSGTAGNPLLYQFNAGAAVTMATNVQQLNFSALTRSIPATSTGLASTIIAYASPPEGKTPGTAGTSVTILRPTGLVPGNLLIAAVAVDGSVAAEMTPPAGWTLVNRLADGSNNVTLAVWWRVAGVAEPTNYAFTWTSPKKAYGWVMRFGGVEPTAPIDTTATLMGAGSYPVCPTVTTTVANAMVVRIGAFDDGDVDVDDPDMSDHTTLTLDESDNGDSASGPASGGATYKLQAATAATGTAQFEINDNEQYVTMTLALRPDDGI
jgi:hypothetical protein